MRILALILACIGFFCLAQAQVPMTGAGLGKPVVTSAPFALDGTPQGGNSGSSSAFALPAFTSTYGSAGNEIGIILVITNGGPVTSISGCGSWTNRSRATGGGTTLEEWYSTPASAYSSSVCTVNTTSASFISASIQAFSGGHTAAPFDTNVLLPGTATSSVTYALCTTTNANDILIGLVESSGPGVGGSWVSLYGNGAQFIQAEYQIVSATQIALTTGPGNVPSNQGNSLCDAIIQGP